MSTYINWRPNDRVSIGGTCKHCGSAIHLRSEAQGWLHTDERAECRPLRAEPLDDDPRVDA